MSKAQENNNNSISANNSEQDSNSDPFHFYSSKIKPIYIPIVGLKERKSDNECSDHLFIGRKRLISKLKGWLEDNSKNGVYLISGYRGMGKTSFVNKVLKDINCNNFYPENKFALKFINSLAYWTLFIFYLYFFSAIFLNKLIPSYDNIKLSSLLKEVISPNILSTIFWIFVLIIFTFTIIFFTFTLIIYITTSYKISNKRVKREKKSRIAIKLNLGSEVLKERDILALISKMLHEKYAGYKSKFYYSHPYIGIFSLFIKAFLCTIITYSSINLLIIVSQFLKCKEICFGCFFNELPSKSIHFFVLISFLLYPLVRYLLYTILSYLSNAFSSLKSMPNNILKKLALLNERINAVVTDENESKLVIKNSIFGRKKGRSYPIANVREIEQELILILDSIKDYGIYKAPEFIFIFDELDKIDSISTEILDDKELLPEYENAISGFPGGATSRKRKQNILNLLANMKYFVSTANAKFIFISGRELYDASLSDVSDREFAISSIFTGVIYLDSFLSPQNNIKEVSSMTEKYICKHLIPYDYILNIKLLKLIRELKEEQNLNKETPQDTKSKWKVFKLTLHSKLCNYTESQAIIEIKKELKKELEKRNHIENKKYKIRNNCYILFTRLNLTFDCFISKLEKELEREFKVQESDKEKQAIFFDTSNEEDDYYSLRTYNLYLRNMYTPENGNISMEDTLMIDRVIIQLYHFSIYLTHISNGAPKKITSYFEKYVNTSILDKPENIIIIRQKEVPDEREREKFLTFKYRDQQKINFIHYMAYPVMQAVINTSGNFGDKLLLTAAFLTDHIYKHHKDGFSWRNLELVPELLDTDKTPELRSFINSIICFLKQTHLSTIYSGVYNLKFPRKISEEISVFSKLSEEVSAIFNFTLDESFSVKRYYAKLSNYYSGQLGTDKANVEYPIPMTDSNQRTLANIHHILADLYLSEEDFSNAIFEYQKCAGLLSASHQITASGLLFYIRNMLKLGLAYERRNTFDSAYFVYQELTSLLISYRYFNEKDYGLVYNQNLNIVKTENTQKRLRKEKVLPTLIETKLSEMNCLIPKLALFEDVRFIYQPLLAKLLVVEKLEFGGVTRDKMAEIEEEFKFLSRLVNEEEKFFIIANFYREMGDVMYYKNGFLQNKIGTDKKEDPIKAWDLWSYDIENSIDYYIKNYESELMHFLEEICADELTKIIKSYNIKQDLDELIKKTQFDPICKNTFQSHITIFITDYIREKNKANSNDEKSENNHINAFIENYINDKKNQFMTFFKEISETDLVNLIYKKEKSLTELIDQHIKYHLLKNYSKETRTQLKEIIYKYMIKKCSTKIKTKEQKEKETSHIIFSKMVECYKRRMDCKSNNNYYPCYACKFYNKSLRILLKNAFNVDSTENKLTKTIILWNCLYNATVPPREDTLVLIANILNAFGSVMLSCANNKKDKISKEFLNAFFEAIELSERKGTTHTVENKGKDIKTIFYDNLNNEMSFLEKSILYFWVASEYYKSSNSKESSYCYEKILHIFLIYLKTQRVEEPKEDNFGAILSHIEKIEEYIVNDAIRYLYSNYEKINITELQKLKWMLSKDMYHNIPLNMLSLFPDIEGILDTYYELNIELKKYYGNNELYKNSKELDKINKNLKILYNSSVLTTNHIDSTISERVRSLHLKAQYNRMIFMELFVDKNNKDLDLEGKLTSDDIISMFYGCLYNYLNKEKSLSEILDKKEINMYESDYLIKKDSSSEKDIIEEKIKFLQFIFHDSLFCLSIIIEKIGHIKDLTLFSQSFIADIYYQLYEWNKMLELLYTVFRFSLVEDNKIECDELNKKIQKEIKKNCPSLKKIGFLGIARFYRCYFLVNKYKDICHNFIKFYDKEVRHNATESRVDYLNVNYCAEMAISKYRQAMELHSEGKAYKEFISKVYLQNDDLNNNTYQFQHAVERYLINCGYINDKSANLKRLFAKSGLYDVNEYAI